MAKGKKALFPLGTREPVPEEERGKQYSLRAAIRNKRVPRRKELRPVVNFYGKIQQRFGLPLVCCSLLRQLRFPFLLSVVFFLGGVAVTPFLILQTLSASSGLFLLLFHLIELIGFEVGRISFLWGGARGDEVLSMRSTRRERK